MESNKVKKKDYIKSIQEATNNKDVSNLGRWLVQYFQSPYVMAGKSTDLPISLFERFILDPKNSKINYSFSKTNKIYPGLENVFLEAASYYSRVGKYAEAEKLIEALYKSKSNNLRFEKIKDDIQYAEHLLMLRRELSKPQPDEVLVRLLRKAMATNPSRNYGNTLVDKPAEEATDFDILRTYFNVEINPEDLTEDIFPEEMRTLEEQQDEDNGGVTGGEYKAEFSAKNRLEFLKENFDIRAGRLGEGPFAGTILLTIGDSDIAVLEKFYDETKDGKFVESYGQATYIIHKDVPIDLTQLTIGKIIPRNDPRVDRVTHAGDYYGKLTRAIEKALIGEFEQEDIIEQQEQTEQPEEVLEDKETLGEKIQRLNELYKKSEELQKVLESKIKEVEAAQEDTEAARIQFEEAQEKLKLVEDAIAETRGENGELRLEADKEKKELHEIVSATSEGRKPNIKGEQDSEKTIQEIVDEKVQRLNEIRERKKKLFIDLRKKAEEAKNAEEEKRIAEELYEEAKEKSETAKLLVNGAQANLNQTKKEITQLKGELDDLIDGL